MTDEWKRVLGELEVVITLSFASLGASDARPLGGGGVALGVPSATIAMLSEAIPHWY